MQTKLNSNIVGGHVLVGGLGPWLAPWRYSRWAVRTPNFKTQIRPRSTIRSLNRRLYSKCFLSVYSRTIVVENRVFVDDEAAGLFIRCRLRGRRTPTLTIPGNSCARWTFRICGDRAVLLARNQDKIPMT